MSFVITAPELVLAAAGLAGLGAGSGGRLFGQPGQPGAHG